MKKERSEVQAWPALGREGRHGALRNAPSRPCPRGTLLLRCPVSWWMRIALLPSCAFAHIWWWDPRTCTSKKNCAWANATKCNKPSRHTRTRVNQTYLGPRLVWHFLQVWLKVFKSVVGLLLDLQIQIRAKVKHVIEGRAKRNVNRHETILERFGGQYKPIKWGNVDNGISQLKVLADIVAHLKQPSVLKIFEGKAAHVCCVFANATMIDM